ncbi:MAG: DegV family protein [Lachnospiraceae bacterium]|nr:DegV family protein [Lachnospiraceae bacterium]
MREFVVMADVNTDPDPGYVEKENITILPQYYHFNDGVIYGDGKELTNEEYYGRMEKGERAYSMGCNPDTVHRLMEEELKKGHDIIAIMASSECSGSYSTVCIEANELMEEYPGSTIKVVDSYLETTPAGLLVYMAQEMKKKDCTLDEVYKVVEEQKKNCNILFMVDDLKYLVRGGRLNVVSGALGTLLQIKPILFMDKGLIAPYEKARGRQTAKATILKRLKEMNLDRELLCVLHIADKEEAYALGETIKKELGIEPMWYNEVNKVIGAHIGPGGLGVAFCKIPE